MGWSGLIFPVALGFAVLRDDLLEVDSILRRTVNYVFVSILLALAYAGAFAALSEMFGEAAPVAGGASVVVFATIAFLVFLPLRDRLQAGIDRLFFRSAYDFRRLVETTSERVASFTDLPMIAEAVTKAVSDALHPEWMVLVLSGGDAKAKPMVSVGDVPSEFDAQAAMKVKDVRPFDFAVGSLGIPFRVEERLVAVLLVGRRLSGRIYGGEDRRLLHTLANHGAVAFENALAIEQVRELNRGLEAEVAERTAELREAQAQLVHREKMASLGQLVAGVAHEMNNPLNFLQGNLYVLRQFSESLVRSLEESHALVSEHAPDRLKEFKSIRERNDIDAILQDLGTTLSACEDAVGRTTKIVAGLNTFSRHGRAQVSRVDIEDVLERTMTVLQGRFKGIEVKKEYGKPPNVECLADELAQVFMNLLTNAADAVREGGQITVRTLAVGVGRVRIEVEDNGSGIDPAIQGRIFEPFFTTKEVGHGTGLGLAITYGVVTRHRGTIEMTSELEKGSRFSVELPVNFEGEAVG
jgi:signal transduction histidine kinase